MASVCEIKMSSECEVADDLRLTLQSELDDLKSDYGCSLEQSINEEHLSSPSGHSERTETSQSTPTGPQSTSGTSQSIFLGFPVPFDETANDKRSKKIFLRKNKKDLGMACHIPPLKKAKELVKSLMYMYV